MPRLFVALDVPEAVAEILASVCTELDGARWITQAHYHVTLRFIGNVDAARAEQLTESLATISSVPFSLAIQGLGVFPSFRNPRVLFANIRPQPTLSTVHAAVTNCLAQHDISPEDRLYRPHITLAYLRETDPVTVRHIAKAHASLHATFPVNQLHLYESKLKHTGPEYHKQKTFMLETVW